MEVRNNYKLHKKDFNKISREDKDQQLNVLASLRQNFYDKLFRDLRSKHKSLDKKDVKQFIDEYGQVIDKISREYVNDDYSSILNRVDKIISEGEKGNYKTEKALNKENIQPNLNGKDRITNAYSRMQPIDKINNSSNGKNRLIEKLEEKKNDEWAKIIQIQNKNFNLEMQRKQNEILNKKEIFKELLLQQIEEKRKVENKKKEEERRLDKELIEMERNKYLKQNQEMEEKYKRNKYYYDKFFEENERNLRLKNEIKKRENQEEIINLNKTKTKLEQEKRKDQELLKEKKNEEMELKKFLETQIRLKENQRQFEKSCKLEEKSKYQKLNEEILKDKEDRCTWYRISQKKYKDLLDEQIKKRQILPSMSDEERKINKKLLEEQL